MRDKLKRIGAYIFRGWNKEPGYTHPNIKILPPFVFELIAYLLALSVIYQALLYLFNRLN